MSSRLCYVPYPVSPLRKNPELMVGMFCKHGAGSVSHIENDLQKKKNGGRNRLLKVNKRKVRARRTGGIGEATGTQSCLP